MEKFKWLQYMSQYMQTCYIVYGMMVNYGIETTYDAFLPSYLHQNLYFGRQPNAYWTLSSFIGDYYSAWYVYPGGVVEYSNVSNNAFGVRPVITISKSKL